MGRIFAWSTVITLALMGCATAPLVPPQQHFSGWMLYRGEVMLFSTHADYLMAADSRRRAACFDSSGVFQCEMRCISGMLAGEDRDLRAWDGRWVVITGKLVNYESLPNDGEPILPRKVLADKIVPNFCLRDEVILITNVVPA